MQTSNRYLYLERTLLVWLPWVVAPLHDCHCLREILKFGQLAGTSRKPDGCSVCVPTVTATLAGILRRASLAVGASSCASSFPLWFVVRRDGRPRTLARGGLPWRFAMELAPTVKPSGCGSDSRPFFCFFCALDVIFKSSCTGALRPASDEVNEYLMHFMYLMHLMHHDMDECLAMHDA